MSLVIREITPRIASEVLVEPAALYEADHGSEFRDLLERRGVLVFRRVGLSDKQQVMFSRTLGEVIEQGKDGIFKVTLDPEVNKMAEYLRGTVLWHLDGWSDDVPTRGSVLSARKTSAIGGQTEFANTYAAYEDLPDQRKHEIGQLRIVHTMDATLRDVFPDPTLEQKATWDKFSQRIHPLVWTHRSGRKSLVLGSSADTVVGMPEAAGRTLIRELMQWSTQPAFVYRHEWQVGDMVVWDNTGVLHRVEAYPADSGRLMHRTTLVGEEPIG